MTWMMLILFPQTYNLIIRKLCCMCFEDNETVIKMIIKGRRPTIRHVSRTHRVALDKLFDRINLDPTVQIKYVDTKNQLADILTWQKVTSHVMSGTVFSVRSTAALRRCRKGHRSRRGMNCGKVKTDDELGFEDCSNIFNGAKFECIVSRDTQSIQSNLWSLKARAGKLAAKDSNENNAASMSQVRQPDVKPNASAGRPAASGTNQKLEPFSECGETCR